MFNNNLPLPFNIPASPQVVIDRIKTDVQSNVDDAAPFLRVKYVSALITAYAGRDFSTNLSVRQLLLQMFPNTASGIYLRMWGEWLPGDVEPTPAVGSGGYATVNGIAGSIIASESLMQTADGLQFQTIGSTQVALHTVAITSITRVGSTAIATTASDHGLASQISVTIYGADQSEYNKTASIEVTSKTTFQYTVSGAPATPATGILSYDAEVAFLEVEAISDGSDTNQDGGASLNFTTPIAGVNNPAYVQFEGLSGGANEETNEAYHDRVLYEYQNPIAYFNRSAIKAKVKSISGNTRAWVFGVDDTQQNVGISSLTQSGGAAIAVCSGPHNLTDQMLVTISGADQSAYNGTYPILVINATSFLYVVDSSAVSPATGTIEMASSLVEPGQVQVYFMRDNDDNPIPTSFEVNAAKNALLAIAPPELESKDLMVRAPTGVSTDFVIADLVPNTVSMQDAIRARLQELFSEDTEVGENVPEIAYQAAIFQTLDPETGDRVRSFTLNTPSGDIAIGRGEIALLGTVSYV